MAGAAVDHHVSFLLEIGLDRCGGVQAGVVGGDHSGIPLGERPEIRNERGAAYLAEAYTGWQQAA